MRKTAKKICVGGLVMALSLAIADDICRREDLKYTQKRLVEETSNWEKEMRSRIDWMYMAREYRWNRDFSGLECLDNRFDDLAAIERKHVD